MIARNMKSILENPANGVIRKMFEEGALLKKKYGEDNVYDFSIGNPDLDPPSEVVEAIEEIAADTSPMCHGYMPNPGYMQARQAMAEKTSLEQGTAVPADCVIMSVGAAGAMNCVFKALLNVGDEVIVPAPYFAEYGHYCANHGGTLRPVPTKNDFSLDIDAIKAALTEKTAAVIINSPNNPTGRIYSREEIQALSAVLTAHGEKTGRYPYIVCDEPYRAITYGGKKVAPVFPEYRQAVVVTSFAKNLSVPGERIGYIAVNPASDDASEMVAACILATRILGFVNAPAFFQKVIARSWNARCDYSLYEKRCREIMEIMDYAGLQYAKPEGAFYLFVKVPEGWNGDDMAFTEHLKKFNILCAPGTGFGGKGWFRISYCVAEKTILNSKEAFYKSVHSK
ncbi:MAG: pyridoxal phosphate-dependent aminotransferase [Treponema porcinum]|uniref:pyridoxal phosphate-dependent aminotransferase n=1 Tax=Treponema porcinum TaxID=261392 RepID=UPI00235424A5|nr:pyridoxal phosphate-dependent aminotransferase [Treponema porcinum]MCI6180399.1 pyridoxal phosphate-dependent aminotransferase [Treponema porcinum]MCI6983549.1 pyridoxal phosphate-dependent aminotransferase [Treponema porcinum]MCI7535165.1 pyridoxal phosphate-dependent aminotransferase [Treponema porcinum]MCI7546832.1 pyridoxal phosphate-dependent aminotransferase [Treponema porcinum]MDY4189092.1 pyridoxal phosphate-dependent aminotransferase [Treponema porcinum]